MKQVEAPIQGVGGQVAGELEKVAAFGETAHVVLFEVARDPVELVPI
jgi:hypothetical protein